MYVILYLALLHPVCYLLRRGVFLSVWSASRSSGKRPQRKEFVRLRLKGKVFRSNCSERQDAFSHKKSDRCPELEVKPSPTFTPPQTRPIMAQMGHVNCWMKKTFVATISTPFSSIPGTVCACIFWFCKDLSKPHHSLYIGMMSRKLRLVQVKASVGEIGANVI